MSCTITEWRATASGQGDDRIITVTGDGECPTTGYQLHLKPTNEGIVDDPRTVAVALTIEAPAPGTAVQEIITPVHVELEIHGDPATKVRIDTPSGSEWAEVAEVAEADASI